MIGPPWYSSLAVPAVASAGADACSEGGSAPRSGCTLTLWPLGRFTSSAEALLVRLPSVRAATAKPAKASRAAPRRAVHGDAPAEHGVPRVGDRVGDALGGRRRVREVFCDRADAFLQITRPVRP